jgi:hypothetical protein
MKPAGRFALVLLCCFQTTSAFAWKPSAYLYCNARDYASVDGFGWISHSENRVKEDILSKQFVLDIDTGLLRRSDGRLMELEVLNRGTATSETVLAPKGAKKADVARFSLHLRDFEDRTRYPSIVFWIKAGNDMVSGNCDAKG